MRIAIIAPAWFAVPPVRYGGIEWVVSILADGLVDQGNDVTLFGEITQINGNDSVNLYGPNTEAGAPAERSNDVFGQGWRENAREFPRTIFPTVSTTW